MSATLTAAATARVTPQRRFQKWQELTLLARGCITALPIGSVLLLNFFGEQNVPDELRFVASLYILLCWIPFVIHVMSARRGLPFLPVLGLIHGLYYAAGVFLLDKFYIGQIKYYITDDVLLRTEVLAISGFIMLLLGYYIWPESAFKGLPRARIDLDFATGTQVAAGIGLLCVLISRPEVQGAVPVQYKSLMALFSQLLSFCVAMLFYYHLKGRLGTALKIYLWSFLVPYWMLSALVTGLLATVVMHFFVLLATYWVARHKWPWKVALLGFLLMIPLLGTKQEFRRRAWAPSGPEGVLARTGLFLEVLQESWTTNETFFQDTYQVAIRRADMLLTFAAVVYMTPDIVPYWGGDSYGTLFWAFIPRVLYPDKPEKTLGQDFGHRYGLLDNGDRATSYNFPQMVEMYANFGPFGVMIGMFIVGIICRSLYYMIAHKDAGEGGFLFAGIVFSQLCNVESDFSLVFGSLALNAMAFYVVVKLMPTRQVRLPVAASGWR